jgi:ADP-ribosyl-[dinitrogen reductase] hydrolase
LASGDALGATNEFKARGSFYPVYYMVGGGPFKLLPGQWTDDTSMALCLAASLIRQKGFDAHDQMRRYQRWNRTGYMSCTGRCIDVGDTVRFALEKYRQEGEVYAGPRDPQYAGNGSLMRIAPIALYYYKELEQAERFAAESSRTTHGAMEAIDACRLFVRMLVRAINGDAKEDVLLADAEGFEGVQSIQAIARGEYTSKIYDEIRGTGYVVDSLIAALWCFAVTDSLQQALIQAANMGGDTDTIAAICGQLAGAYYGRSQIPVEWLERVWWVDEISEIADLLCPEERAVSEAETLWLERLGLLSSEKRIS